MSAHLPMAVRHRIAILIRLRQELQKRLGGRRRSEPTQREAARLKGAGPHPLMAHLAQLDRQSCPESERLVEDADVVRQGRFGVFGHEVVFPETVAWRQHPLSRVDTPLLPWAQLKYLHGECGGDVKYIWELNRHHGLLRLAQSCFLEGPDSASAALARFLDSWMDQNPPGWGINWVSSLEVGLRAYTWCWIAALTWERPLWSGPRRGRFLWYLQQHGCHIERFDSVHHSPNTHLSGEGLALLALGAVFPAFPESARWRRFGLDILEEEGRLQLLSDGMHFERATGYHRYTVEFLLHAILLLRMANGGSESGALEEAARRALLPLAALRRPDGSVPVLGDEDGGGALGLSVAPARNIAPLLTLASGLLGIPAEGPEGAEDLAWWCVPASRDSARSGASAPAATRPSLALAASGYYSARDTVSADPWYCLIDAGPHGGRGTGHAHDDCGHVEIARGNLRLSIDPGSQTYTGDAQRRAWDRSAAAHATLLLEDHPLSEMTGPFSWGLLPPDPVAHVVEQPSWWACRMHRRLGGAAGAPVHERHAVLARGLGIVIFDRLQGARSERFRITWPFPFAPERLQPSPGYLKIEEAVVLAWDWSDVQERDVAVVAHPFAPTYGVSEMGAALRLVGRAESVSRVVTIFRSTETKSQLTWSGDALRVQLDSMQIELRPGQDPAVVAPGARKE